MRLAVFRCSRRANRSEVTKKYGDFVASSTIIPVVVSIFPSSVEKGHIAHGLGLTLRVHQHLVPAVERDRGVVRVADATLDVDTGVPLHGAPAPAPALGLGVAGQDLLVLRRHDRSEE